MRWVEILLDTPRTDGPAFVRGRIYRLKDETAAELIAAGRAREMDTRTPTTDAHKRETR